MKRGEIYYVTLPDLRGSVERGYRPVVVVSSSIGLTTSDIVTVVPVTSKIKERSCNVRISWAAPSPLTSWAPQYSQALCNQVMTLPRHMFNQPQACVTAQELADINAAIMLSLGLASKSHTDIVQKIQEDTKKLKELIPQAKDLIKQLRELVKPTKRAPKTHVIKPQRRKYLKLTQEQKEAFISAWRYIEKYDTEQKRLVAQEHGFTSITQAAAAYKRYTAC